ncbi:MAG: hypothetical protein GEU97_10965 [Actinophytocola sp.]|nr:hypothetical protein [Actinophytocola sp.]
MGGRTAIATQHRPVDPGFRRCPSPRRVGLCVVAVLALSGCGPRVGYELAAITDGPAVSRNHDSQAPQRVVRKEKADRWHQHERNAAPEPPRTTTTKRPAPPKPQPQQPKPRRTATRAPVPAAEPAPKPKNERCDWMANFEHGKAGRPADWIILDTGAWGRAEVPGDRIWIAPRTPCDKVYSVAVHEWTHHMQGHVYRDWAEVERELAPYGGPEMVADCGALLLGATWIKYGCPGRLTTDAAAAILRGERPRSRSRHG